MEKKKLAIFDFDGTITSHDSMIEFIRYCKGGNSLLMSYIALFPWLAGVKLGLASRENAKKRLLSYHFKGDTRDMIALRAKQFAIDILPAFLREKALDQIQFHRQHHHEILVVTASLDMWVEPWMKQMNLNYISTKAEFVNERFTGNFLTPNCSGAEKVRRIREQYKLEDYETIFAYGDSAEDRAFLGIAHRKYFRPFRTPVKKAIVEEF